MDSHTQLMACLIIGEGTLPRQCAELLLERGHGIVGLVSPDVVLRAWATERGIRCAEPPTDLRGFCTAEPFDVLFSISNGLILSGELLALPRRAAINYHDGPLPRYAGMHVTSWALMNGETSHGVTWHLMDERVDAGDLLKQPQIEIAAGETALTLNAKCYEAALLSFRELLEELERDQLTPWPQDLSRRTYFARRQRPAAGGILRWDRPAREIDALVRALEFGPFRNALGRPRLLIGAEALIVPRIVVLSGETAAPGTILRAADDFLIVATADLPVEISQLQSLGGQPLSVTEAIVRHGLREGDRLTVLDAASAQRITQLSEQAGSHEPFWIERLANLLPAAVPLTRRVTAPADSGQPGRFSMAIPESVRAALAARGAGERVEECLVTTFAAFLARITGETSFDLGWGDAGSQHDLKGMESLFAVHLPLRVEMNLMAPVSELHRWIQQEVERVQQHWTYALDLEVRHPALRGSTGPSGRRTFPLMIQRGGSPGDWSAEAGSDLSLIVSDEKECVWLYDRGSFDEAAIAGMARQFTTLLCAAAADPEQPVAHLPLLSEEERHRLLVTFNDTAADYPGDRCVHELFEEQVERTPGAVAVRFEGRCLTYRELNRRANQLARHLQSLGVGPEVLVGLCVERSLEMMVGLLGIMKAGGAYVPLDPAYPRDRIAFMLSDARVPVVLTQERLLAGLPPTTARVVCLERETIAGPSDENPTSKVTADDLVYVIFTSGSTGQPKGSMIPHRGIVNRLLWMQETWPLTTADRVLQKTPFSFDVSVCEFFGPLLAGSVVVVARPGGHQDPAYLVRMIEEQQITTAHFVPSMLQVFLDEPGLERCSSLQRVFCGGEALPHPLQERFFAQLDATLYNLYGPTEASVYVTHWECERESDRQIVPIGRPISNTRTYVLDRRMEPAPVGVPGELWIGGVGLARGYMRRPGLTAERFVPDPFSDEPGARLYRTGDVVRWLPEGSLEFLGRLDHQVKLRGFRIELEEIERALGQHAGVREAAVLAREDEPGEKRLVAYWVSRSGRDPSTPELRAHLQERLPEYMVPAFFMRLESLPLTPNGKVDRRSLPAPGGVRPELTAGYVPPRSPLEEVLVGVWSGLLDIDKIGIEDSFFELGGDSLLATRCITQLQRELQVTLPLRVLFETPTVAGLALTIAEWLAQEVDAESMAGLIGAPDGGGR